MPNQLSRVRQALRLAADVQFAVAVVGPALGGGAIGAALVGAVAEVDWWWATLFGIGLFLFILAIWLVVEAVIAIRRYYREEPVESLDVFPDQ